MRQETVMTEIIDGSLKESLFYKDLNAVSRLSIYEAMELDDVLRRRASSYYMCGTRGESYECKHGGVYDYLGVDKYVKLKLYHCKIRICSICSGYRWFCLYKKYYKILERFANYRMLRMVTFTYGDIPDLDNRLINELFGKAEKIIRKFKNYRGAILTSEVKTTEHSRYYFHIHCLVISSYTDQKQVRDWWNEATGRYIVDIRAKNKKTGQWLTAGKCLEYITKYVCKTPELSNVEDIIDYQKLMTSKKIVRTMGVLYKIKMPKSPKGVLCKVCGKDMVLIEQFILCFEALLDKRQHLSKINGYISKIMVGDYG